MPTYRDKLYFFKQIIAIREASVYNRMALILIPAQYRCYSYVQRYDRDVEYNPFVHRVQPSLSYLIFHWCDREEIILVLLPNAGGLWI